MTSTLLWSTRDGVECRIAAYSDDQCQLMLQWYEETIRTAVVSGYAGALSTSRKWRQSAAAVVHLYHVHMTTRSSVTSRGRATMLTPASRRSRSDIEPDQARCRDRSLRERPVMQ